MSEMFSEIRRTAAALDLSNEWFTPRKYVAAACEVMGGPIELDPASCEDANQFIQAERYYTQAQDGLAQDWACKRMWLNPPYGMHPCGKSNIAVWSRRLINEYECGNIEQALLVPMSNTEASWFVPLWDYPVCFPNPRVMFHRPGGRMDHHIQGTCFVYLGPHRAKFIQVFEQFGIVVVRASTPRPKLQPDLWSQEESA